MEGDAFQLASACIQNPVFLGDWSHDLLLALDNIEAKGAEFLGEKSCRFGMSRLPKGPVPCCQNQRTIFFNSCTVESFLERFGIRCDRRIPSPPLVCWRNVEEKNGKAGQKGCAKEQRGHKTRQTGWLG